MTRRKAEPAKAGKKTREVPHAATASDESECGPASKIIDMKGLSAEDALRLALTTPWRDEKKKTAGPDAPGPAGND